MPQLVPVILAVSAIAGVASTAYGAVQQSKASKQRSQFEQQIAADQQRQEALRRQQMELDNRRKRIEAVRQQQRARAIALATATAQGAGEGGSSALPGAYGQIGGQTGNNLLGLSQSLALGRANFDLSADISSARYGIASANSSYATGQGFSSLGGAIISSLGPISSLAGGFGTSSAAPAEGSGYYNPYGSSSYGAVY